MTGPQPVVRVGQVWEDDDPRSAGRVLKVIKIINEPGFARAECEVIAVARNVSRDRIGKTTRISIRRMRPGSRGYRYVGEAVESGGAASNGSPANDDPNAPTDGLTTGLTCPDCDQRFVSIERTPRGKRTCPNGHVFILNGTNEFERVN